jgi:hypothetical protein
MERLNSVFGFKKVDQKPYNHPSSLWRRCNETMKRELRARSDQEVKNACSTIFLKLEANGLQHVLEKWLERCKKGTACQGSYFEKETVTAPPERSDSE